MSQQHVNDGQAGTPAEREAITRLAITKVIVNQQAVKDFATSLGHAKLRDQVHEDIHECFEREPYGPHICTRRAAIDEDGSNWLVICIATNSGFFIDLAFTVKIENPPVDYDAFMEALSQKAEELAREAFNRARGRCDCGQVHKGTCGSYRE